MPSLRTAPPQAATLFMAVVAAGAAFGAYTAHQRLIAIVAAAVGVVIFVAFVAGENITVDIGAGTVRYRRASDWGPVTAPLANLGELVIDEPKRAALMYQLRATGLSDAILYESKKRAQVEARREQLLRFAAAAALRPILATTHTTSDGAFRDAPQLLERARTAVSDAAYIERAAFLLESDHDAGVRAAARALRAELQARS